MNWGKKESVLTLKGAAPRQVSVEARTPQSIPVTYNKTKTRGKHVRPKDNPGSWVWYSDFKSLYTFEQKRLRPYQGPLSLMEHESLPLLVLWVCQRSSKVDWPTLYFKARSRRVPVATGCGKCQGFKGVEKTRFARRQTLRLWPL